MGMSVMLAIAMGLLFLAGAAFTLARTAGGKVLALPPPVPVMALGAAAFAGFVFWACSGYVWLLQAFGSQVMFLGFGLLNVLAPLACLMFCLWVLVKSRGHIRWFLASWACLALGLLGALSLGLSGM